MASWKDRLNSQDWLNQEEKNLFLNFAQSAQRGEDRVSDIRVQKYLTDLVQAHSISDMGLSAMLKDMEGLTLAIDKINANKAKAWATKKDIKTILGRFYNFQHNGDISLKDADSSLKKLVRHKMKAEDKRDKKPVIKRAEMLEMLQYCNVRDQALICLLFDGGARIGEFVQHTKKDIQVIKEGLQVHVPRGKTFERDIMVIESKRYLVPWLNAHPSKSEEASLWVDDKGKVLGEAAIAKRIEVAVKKMNKARKAKGLPLFIKPYNPHWFRHSRATELGSLPGMTESILNQIMGWEQGSSMARIYIHQIDEDKIKNAILVAEGKAKPAEVLSDKWSCRSCKDENNNSLNYCGKCGSPKEADKEIIRVAQLEQRVIDLETKLQKVFPYLVGAIDSEDPEEAKAAFDLLPDHMKKFLSKQKR